MYQCEPWLLKLTKGCGAMHIKDDCDAMRVQQLDHLKKQGDNQAVEVSLHHVISHTHCSKPCHHYLQGHHSTQEVYVLY